MQTVALMQPALLPCSAAPLLLVLQVLAFLEAPVRLLLAPQARQAFLAAAFQLQQARPASSAPPLPSDNPLGGFHSAPPPAYLELPQLSGRARLDQTIEPDMTSVFEVILYSISLKR